MLIWDEPLVDRRPVNKQMRVLFAGCELSLFSIAVLESLVAAKDIAVTVFISQPTRRGPLATVSRALRERNLKSIIRTGARLIRSRVRLALRAGGLTLTGITSLSELSKQHALRVMPKARINASETRKSISALAPDVLLVAALDQIIKRRTLEIPRIACVNVHPSLLPSHRGPNPFYWVLTHGDQYTGVSFHLMDEGIDTGDLLAQEAFDVAPGETEFSLQQRSAKLAARMAPGVVHGLWNGTISAVPQPEDGASYDPKPPPGASEL